MAQAELARSAAAAFRALHLNGEAPCFQAALDRIARVAPCPAPVLIEGETGTGKELAARAIHRLSQRRERAFVPVNCGTLPETLVESELFGHVRGAFTDARENRAGLVAAAAGGTLFLDEVDSLPARGQVALLRLLQEHEYRPVGGRATLRSDIRVIAATNAGLEGAVARGAFREDLLFRLKVLTVAMPPLRERDGDAALLARGFLARYAAEHGRPVPRLAPETEAALGAHRWPGNVRELENVLLGAFLMADDGAPLRLPFPEPAPAPMADDGLFREARARALVAFERRYLTGLLRRADGNMSQAARLAGKERSSLIRLVRKHGLRRTDFAGGAGAV